MSATFSWAETGDDEAVVSDVLDCSERVQLVLLALLVSPCMSTGSLDPIATGLPPGAEPNREDLMVVPGFCNQFFIE